MPASLSTFAAHSRAAGGGPPAGVTPPNITSSLRRGSTLSPKTIAQNSLCMIVFPLEFGTFMSAVTLPNVVAGVSERMAIQRLLIRTRSHRQMLHSAFLAPTIAPNSRFGSEVCGVHHVGNAYPVSPIRS